MISTHFDVRRAIFLVRADAASASPVRLTDDDGVASKYPDLAFGPDAAAITWFDVPPA